MHELAAATHDMAMVATSGLRGEKWNHILTRVGRSLNVIEDELHLIKYIFRYNIEEYIYRLKGAATAIRAAALTHRIKVSKPPVADDAFLAAAIKRVETARPRAFAAHRELRDAFAPYLANDRTFGLSAEARRLAMRDPALRPQKPYRPGSPT